MIIGLTGASGSGKSLAADFFRKQDFYIMDFDKISREVCMPGEPCLKELAAEFGEDILDENGRLKRKYLGDIVFRDSKKLEILNKITTGHILKRANMLKEQNSHRHIIYDAPRLFEAGLDKECDKVICIICDTDTKVARIMERDGICEETARGRINSQQDNSYYIENSDYSIENNSSPEEFCEKLENLLKELNIYGASA